MTHVADCQQFIRSIVDTSANRGRTDADQNVA